MLECHLTGDLAHLEINPRYFFIIHDQAKLANECPFSQNSRKGISYFLIIYSEI
jgi:hypothetical protein